MPTEVADILAHALLADAEAHEAGHFGEIGERYDDVYAERPVRIALDFWDGWIDVRGPR